MKTNLIGLGLVAAMVTSFVAFADDGDDEQAAVAAEPAPQESGAYLAPNGQQWVPGRYQQVYVSNCDGWTGVRCHSGHLENRWIPGYYVAVQPRVWAPSFPRPYLGLSIGRVHRWAPHARIGVRFGFH